MGYTVVINCQKSGVWPIKELPSGETAFQRVCAYAQSLENTEKVIVLGTPETQIPGEFEVFTPSGPLFKDLLADINRMKIESESIIYLFGDLPFIDTGLTAKLIKLHERYFAHYTFADGYPYGLAPELMKTDLVPALAGMLDKFPALGEAQTGRDSFFGLIQKDINAFDIETDIAPDDLRLLRLSLSADNRRNFLLCSTLDRYSPGGWEEVTALIKEHPEALRTVPAYVNVQITDGCPQSCSYCPFPQFGGDILTNRNAMTTEKFRHIVDQVSSFCGDVWISVSLWGEPSLHPDFPGILKAMADREGVYPVIETSGIGWKPETVAELKKICPEDVIWIVSLDAAESGLYKKLRGEGFEEAVSFAEKVRQLWPETAFVQAVRMKTGEEQLETFYRRWHEQGGNVIIQKHDHFSHYLPERKVTDISPLRRMPCWHLKRDLSVLIDGTVPLCREDLNKEEVLGNIFSDELETIWSRMEHRYIEHTQGTYSGICGGCDEYYTYNF